MTGCYSLRVASTEHGFGIWPSLPQSIRDNLIVNAVLSCRLRDRQSFVPNVQPVVSSGVVALLRRCGPTAITGFIIPVVVDAIQCEAIWRRIHVCHKASEVISPEVRHYNTAASVVIKLFIPRIVATLSGVLPRYVLTRYASFLREAMCGRPSAGHFSTETPATIGAPSYCLCEHCSHGAAVTKAHPTYGTAIADDWMKDEQSSGALVRPILERSSHHIAIVSTLDVGPCHIGRNGKE